MNKKISSFRVYANNYRLMKMLPQNDKEKIALSIFEYMFEDKEPNFKEDSDIYAVWINIQMVLNKSKRNAINGLKGGAPIGNNNAEKTTENTTQKTSEKQPKKQPKHDPKKQTNIISTFYFIINNFNYLKDRGLLRGKIKEWLDYKYERNEPYKETGFKSLLTQIKNNTEKYGEENVINLINDCMASNYKGIIWDRLANVKKNPEWFNKNILENEATEDEIKEIEKTLEA